METKQGIPVIIDARTVPPSERHGKIFGLFMSLKPGQELHVKVDHDPIHLVEHMNHAGLPIDVSAYSSHMDKDGTFTGIFRKLQNAPGKDRVKVTSVNEERAYLDGRFNPVGIYAADNYKVIITYIRAGQFIPVHSPSTDLIFAVFTGTGTAFAGEKEVPLIPGSILIIPGGEKRGIKAKTDMEALHVVSPVPDESDHRDVIGKLLKNRYI
ncbi:MAG: DUF2249 domain-containing protein [Cuniculiplasma sp.]